MQFIFTLTARKKHLSTSQRYIEQNAINLGIQTISRTLFIVYHVIENGTFCLSFILNDLICDMEHLVCSLYGFSENT